MIPHSLKTFVKKSPHVFQNFKKFEFSDYILVTSKFLTMGQALSSCAACCSGNAQGCKDETYQKAGESYQKAVCESYQKEVPKIHNHQLDCGFEKIKTNDDKIVLAVNPKFLEQVIAADQKKILMNLKSKAADRKKILMNLKTQIMLR